MKTEEDIMDKIDEFIDIWTPALMEEDPELGSFRVHLLRLLEQYASQEVEERYDKATVYLRDQRMGIMGTDLEDNALRIAAGLTTK